MPFEPVREEESDLYAYDLLLRDKENWNIARIEELLPTLKNEIMAIRPSVTGQQDSYIWYPDLTWTVVKERCREDSSQGKMCGEWVIVDRCEGTKRKKSRKGKEAAGASVPVVGDGTNLTQVDNLGEQQELGREEEGESSHAGDQKGRGTGAVELAEPSMREVLDVVKAMGTQMLAFTRAFTPLVNSSVGQVTPAQATAQATQRAAQTAGTAADVAQAAARVARTAARTLTGADRLAHSAGNIWWPAQLSSVECYGLGRCGRVMGGYGLVGSWHELPRVRQLDVAFSINRESLAQKMARTSLGKSLPKSHQKDKERKRLAMDTRQRDKEKDKERDVPPGEQTPKVSGVDCKGRSGPADEPYGLVQGTLNLGLGRFRDKVLGLGRTDLWSDLTSRVGFVEN
ncbi:hypothetical protein DY000_02053594 [Brassica cretica]|uniref:VAN3-binding protein-like auxin canalisation domain-containing protein n=1 Tax=Brassica cretica TaxID=69181 RepID=A0ABQ7A9G8_BRACR|nr:hypothetical protein DY000_02053594 [Brassica cretica]